MDVIASTAFGLDSDSQSNPENAFVVNGRKFIGTISSVFSIRIIMLCKLARLAACEIASYNTEMKENCV